MIPSTSSHAFQWRVLLVLLVGMFYGILVLNPQWMLYVGVQPLDSWFSDLRAVLAASDAHALGMSLAHGNPLDPLNQPYIYPSWWFGLHALGLTRHDHVWLGAALVTAFLGAALWQVNARSGAELAWSAAVLCAPGSVLGFERGNVDLVIFLVLSFVPPALAAGRSGSRWLAIALLLLATGLKFYPAAAGLLLLAPTPKRRERWLSLGVFALALILVAVDQSVYELRYMHDWFRPTGLHTFGFGLAGEILGWGQEISFIVALLAILAAGLIGWRWAPASGSDAEDRLDQLRFVLGAVLLAGCYFATVNYDYKLVFAIWLAPFLWSRLRDRNTSRGSRAWAWLTAGSLLAALWFEGIMCLAVNLRGGLPPAAVHPWIRQVVIWDQPIVLSLVVCLLAGIVPFMRTRWRSLRHRDAVVSAAASAG